MSASPNPLSPVNDSPLNDDHRSGADASKRSGPVPNVQAYLHRARLMQAAARSDRRSECLPVLRRLIAASAFAPDIDLKTLFERRAEVRRRHCLLTLAREAGKADWLALRNTLETAPQSIAADIRALPVAFTYPNHWFSSLEQAQQFQRERGGRLLRHGSQAVVIPDED